MKNPFKKKIKNMNTPEFWDKDFQHEYDFYKEKKVKQYLHDWRWDGMRFGAVSHELPIGDFKLLEIGCGLGHFLRFIKARNIDYKCTGLDFSPIGLKYARELTDKVGMKDIEYVRGDAADLPFEDESFDFVVSQETIEHLTDPLTHLKEMKRVLRPGGICIITQPWKHLIFKDKLSTVEHVQEWTPEEFAEFVKPVFEGGSMHFPPILVDRTNGNQTPLYWFQTMLRKEDGRTKIKTTT